jgi:hypothetical protein
MPRPVTLFTGQFADLPFEEVARQAAEWGYDGLEIACWGDHFEVDKAVADASYVKGRREILDRYGLSVFAISCHLTGQAPSTSATRASCPAGSGPTGIPRACGDGRPRRSRTPLVRPRRWGSTP